jgi:hypothetical protein
MSDGADRDVLENRKPDVGLPLDAGRITVEPFLKIEIEDARAEAGLLLLRANGRTGI